MGLKKGFLMKKLWLALKDIESLHKDKTTKKLCFSPNLNDKFLGLQLEDNSKFSFIIDSNKGSLKKRAITQIALSLWKYEKPLSWSGCGLS